MTAPAVAAEKVAAKKVAASQATKKAATSAAKAGEKSAQTRAASGGTSRRNVESGQKKTKESSGPGSPRKEVSPSEGASGSPPAEKPSISKRAITKGSEKSKSFVKQQADKRGKTKSAVESKYRRDKVLGFAELRPKTRMLAAEYIAAMVMAIILLFLHDKDNLTYHKRMSRFFVQMTGITGIFFVLSLLSSSEKTARYAIPFGLLIDTSMLIFLIQKGGAKVINQAIGNAPDDYAAVITKDITEHPTKPLLIAPGLIVTPGNVPVTGGNLGTIVDPTQGTITTPGNTGPGSVLGTPS